MSRYVVVQDGLGANYAAPLSEGANASEVEQAMAYVVSLGFDCCRRSPLRLGTTERPENLPDTYFVEWICSVTFEGRP